MANGNPFYIQPATADITPVLSGLGSVIQRSRDEERRLRDSQALMEAYRSGDPNAVAEMISQYPGLSQPLGQMIGVRNEATQKNLKETARAILSNPENAPEIIERRAQMVREQGGDPTETLGFLQEYQENPQAAIKSVELLYSGLADPQEWKAYQTQTGVGGSALKERALTIKEQALELRREEAAARRDEQRLKREDSQLKRDELKLKIEERRQKIDTKKKDIESAARSQIKQQGNLSTTIDEFLANDKYVDAVTGYRGRAPALTTTGIEAETYFNQIKSNLTLENLDKMSGVLSETDIKILSDAATALQEGMGKDAMVKEMRKIQGVLRDKSQDVQRQILGEPSPETAQGADLSALPKTNEKGWSLMIDAQGNKAYVGPGGEFEEVQ